jgi:hypothetical protein
MKKAVLWLFLFTLIYGGDIRAQEKMDCCCTLQCIFNVPFSGEVTKPVDKCTTLTEEEALLCNEEFVCKIQYPLYSFFYKGYTGQCDVDCPAETLLGRNDPRLEVLRTFRDDVLKKTVIGNTVIDLYYGYSDTIIKIINEDPAIREHARDMLEKLLPRIQAVINSGKNRPVVTEELYRDGELPLEEIDSAATGPLKGMLMNLREGAQQEGLLE